MKKKENRRIRLFKEQWAFINNNTGYQETYHIIFSQEKGVTIEIEKTAKLSTLTEKTLSK